MSRRLKLAIPWVLSFGFVAWILASMDFAAVGDAFQTADLPRVLSLIAGFTVLVFLADAATLTALFRQLITEVRYRDVLAIKGVSYFFNAVNYSAASGAMALFMKKRKDVPFLEALSALLWMNFIDILVLVLMLSLGLGFGSELLPPEQMKVLPWVLLAFGCIILGALAYWHLGIDFFILGRLRSWRIFEAFRRARGSDYLIMMIARASFVFLYVMLAWTTLPAFDLDVPILPLLVYVPLLTFVQIVPATVSGLGAIQEVMIMLYSGYAAGSVDDPRAQVFAFSLLVGPFATLLRLVIGYFFIHSIARDFVPAKGEIDAARAAEEGA